MPKDKIQNFKLEEDVKADFEKLCAENFTTPSHELRLLVHKWIKAHNSKPISINDLKQKNS